MDQIVTMVMNPLTDTLLLLLFLSLLFPLTTTKSLTHSITYLLYSCPSSIIILLYTSTVGCYMLHNEIGEIVLKVRYADFPYGAWTQKNSHPLNHRPLKANG